MEPFSILKRESKPSPDVRYPVNPIVFFETSKLPSKIKILPLHEFCRIKQIPFSENEDRFYKFVRNKYMMAQYKKSFKSDFQCQYFDQPFNLNNLLKKPSKRH